MSETCACSSSHKEQTSCVLVRLLSGHVCVQPTASRCWSWGSQSALRPTVCRADLTGAVLMVVGHVHVRGVKRTLCGMLPVSHVRCVTATNSAMQQVHVMESSALAYNGIVFAACRAGSCSSSLQPPRPKRSETNRSSSSSCSSPAQQAGGCVLQPQPLCSSGTGSC